MRWLRKNKWYLISLTALLAIQVVQAVPTLVWSKNFSNPGNGIAWEINCATGSAGAPPRNQLVTADWDTGDVVIAYTVVGTTDSVTVTRLRYTNGGIIWSRGFSHDIAGNDLGVCGLQLDQRGRLYLALGQGDGETTSKVLRFSDGQEVADLAANLVRPAGTGNEALSGIFVDAWTDESDTMPPVAFTDRGDSGGVVVITPDSGTAYSETCDDSLSIARVMGAVWGRTGTSALWTQHDTNDEVRKVNPLTCATIASQQATGGTTYPAFTDDKIALISVNGANWNFAEYTSDDAFTQIGGDLAVTDFSASTPETIHRALGYDDDSITICGRSSAPSLPFLAQYDGGGATTFSSSFTHAAGAGGSQTISCDYTDNGVVYWAWSSCDGLGICDFTVEKYNGFPDMNFVIPEQADLSAPGDLNTTGGNPVLNAKNFCSAAWKIDCGMAFTFGIVAIGATMFYRRGMPTLIVAILCLCLIGFAFVIGMAPTWFMLLVAFAIIAVAGVKLFTGRGENDE